VLGKRRDFHGQNYGGMFESHGGAIITARMRILQDHVPGDGSRSMPDKAVVVVEGAIGR